MHNILAKGIFFFYCAEELILNNWVFLPEDISHPYKIIEMSFNCPRKMTKKIQDPAHTYIQNFGSIVLL